MSRLTFDQISRENADQESTSVTSLHLSHRALSDVSCLSSCLNLEKLDLSFNCLTSLETLSPCVNLKWLSLVENKLETLRGIERFTKLMVFNAGKNKLQRMDEISSVVSLRAVILNDNNITSICKLDQLTYLNTLVLSRNPIHEIGDSLMKAKSLTKLSLSHCQLQAIGSSLTSCLELKEARLAHNNLSSIPTQLARNIRLQNLDMGNNLVDNWSELKVLSELRNLKNLNLQGNPIAEKDNLVKRVKKLVPNLRIFNAKPMEGINRRGKLPREDAQHPNKGDDPPWQNGSDAEEEKTVHKTKFKTDVKASRKKVSKRSSEELHDLPSSTNTEVEKQTKKKKSITTTGSDSNQTKDDVTTNDAINLRLTKSITGRKSEKKRATTDKDVNNVEANVDNVEGPFLDRDLSSKSFKDLYREMKAHKVVIDGKQHGGLVIEHVKKKKKTRDMDAGPLALQLLQSNSEIGLGGPSMWDG